MQKNYKFDKEKNVIIEMFSKENMKILVTSWLMAVNVEANQIDALDLVIFNDKDMMLAITIITSFSFY